MYAVWLLAGALGGALSVWFNAKQGVRQRARYPRYEVWSWALFLFSLPLIYVGFAVFNGASEEWIWIELAGLAVFGLVAWAGVSRWPVLIGIGWLVHSTWDQGLHPGGSPGYVPAWYPPLCIGFDVYIGAALILRFRGRGRAAAV